MKRYAALLATLLGLSAVYAEPIEIATSDKRNTVWVMYPETFTRMQDGYSVMIAERDATGRTNENRMYTGVMRETCVNGHGALYARPSPQAKWELMSSVTLGTPLTIADATANAICIVGKELDKRVPSDKRKMTI